MATMDYEAVNVLRAQLEMTAKALELFMLDSQGFVTRAYMVRMLEQAEREIRDMRREIGRYGLSVEFEG